VCIEPVVRIIRKGNGNALVTDKYLHTRIKQHEKKKEVIYENEYVVNMFVNKRISDPENM